MSDDVLNFRALETGASNAKRFQKVFEAADQFLGLLDATLQSIDAKAIPRGELSEFQHLLAIAVQKYGRTYVSVLRLCDAGYCEDAKTLIRKIQEVWISLKYMSIDPDDRAHFFRTFGQHIMLKQLKSARESERFEDSKSVIDQLIEKYEAEVSSRSQKYPRGKISGKFKNYWHGKNLFEMAADCGLSGDFNPRNYLLNTATHFTDGDSVSYFDPESWTYKGPDESSSVPYLVVDAVQMMIGLLGLVIEHYHLDSNDQLEFLRNTVNNLRIED